MQGLKELVVRQDISVSAVFYQEYEVFLDRIRKLLFYILHFLSEKKLVWIEDTLTDAFVFLRQKLTQEKPWPLFSGMPQKLFQFSLCLRWWLFPIPPYFPSILQ